MFKGEFQYDEIREDGKFKVYTIDFFGYNIEAMVRESDNKIFYSVADTLKMCSLANRGSYSTNLINNSSEVIKSGRKTYIDSIALFSYIFKGRNEGIMEVKEKFVDFFIKNIDI